MTNTLQPRRPVATAAFRSGLIAALLLIPNQLYGQWGPPNAYAPSFDPFAVCERPSQHATQLFVRVLNHARQYAQVPRVYFCKNRHVPNAHALARGGRFSIHYNPHFMGDADVRVDNDFAIAGILAHEVGHIEHFAQLGQPYSQGGWQAHMDLYVPYQKELRADEFAGFVLAKMGASIEDVVDVQRTVFTLHVNLEYTDSLTRLQRMFRGYINGSLAPPSKEEIDRIIEGQTNLAGQYLRWQ